MPYSRKDVALLVQIRDDILARPEFYADGADRLAATGSVLALCGDRASELCAMRDKVRTAGASLGTVFEDVEEEARWSSWSMARYVVLREVLRRKLCELNTIYVDPEAKATLILAILVWDLDAHTRHPVFAVWDDWHIGKLDPGWLFSVGEANRFLNGKFLGKRARRLWMDHVTTAWLCLPKRSGVPPIGKVGPTGAPRKRRGSLARYDPNRDAKIDQAFRDSGCRTHADFAEANRLDIGDVKRARDRHRKRNH